MRQAAVLVLAALLALGCALPAADAMPRAAKKHCKAAKHRAKAKRRTARKRCKRPRPTKPRQPGAAAPGSPAEPQAPSAPAAPGAPATPGPPEGPGGPTLPEDPGGDGRSLQVQSGEYYLRLSRSSVLAGDVRVEFDNTRGEDPHDLKLAKGTELYSFDEQPSGGLTAKTFHLGKGSWTLFCALQDHASRGMEATLTVTAG
jgi:plastocyanin